MPIRNPFVNPFNKRPTGGDIQDENARPIPVSPKDASAGFERVDTVGSKASSVLSIRTTRSQDTGDYKLSGELLSPAPCHFPLANLHRNSRQ
jgi:hypothetical protein